MLSSNGIPIPLAAGSSRITSDTTLTQESAFRLVIIDASAGNVAVTLPLSSSMARGTYIFFSAPNADVNTVSFEVQGSDTLNGVAAPGTFALPAIAPQGSTVVVGDGGFRLVQQGDTDPLAALSDDFGPGGATASARGFTLFQAVDITSEAVASGDLNIRITGGGGAQSFWFNADTGILIFKDVTGAADMRIRTRVRNNADTGVPPALGFQLAGIAVHDPDRTVPATDLNYVHIAGGTVGGGQNQIEQKNTVNSASAFSGVAVASLSVDLRIDRRLSDPNMFDLYHRQSALEADLAADTNWTLFLTINRTANPIPLLAEWGMMVYASVVGSDIQQFVEEIQYRSSTS